MSRAAYPSPMTPARIRSVALVTSLILALVLLAVLAAVVKNAPLAGAQTGAPATGDIQVHDGTNPGEVIISWDAVPQATHYRIGYVNMETDYPLAKASATGDWINAFIYVDENARNVPVSNGRAEYTIRRLEQNVRHAFTVLTSNRFTDTGGGGSVNSEFSWPSNPRWQFHTVADRGGACPMSCPSDQPPTQPDQPATPAGATVLVMPPLPNQDCVVGLQLGLGDSCNWPHHSRAGISTGTVGISGGGDYPGRPIILWNSQDITVGNPGRDRHSWSAHSGESGSNPTFYRLRIDRVTGDTWNITEVNVPWRR